MDGILADIPEVLDLLEGPLQEPLGLIIVLVDSFLEQIRQLWEVCDDVPVLLVGELGHGGVLLGFGRRRPFAAIDQRDLSEVVAREQGLALLHLSFLVHQVHSHLALRQDVEVGRAVEVVNDRVFWLVELGLQIHHDPLDDIALQLIVKRLVRLHQPFHTLVVGAYFIDFEIEELPELLVFLHGGAKDMNSHLLLETRGDHI
mmetsp:Transcript_33728/g.32762  ORF Transcript_33728/g.32762 Transcript_33728/m.32762 type:complete len:202 (+) Transcript_33728:478-1083(+)